MEHFYSTHAIGHSVENPLTNKRALSPRLLNGRVSSSKHKLKGNPPLKGSMASEFGEWQKRTEKKNLTLRAREKREKKKTL